MAKAINIFSGRDLAAMIAPLFLEQFLIITVGIADTLAISYVGEAAVSGVSLGSQFNLIFIYLFIALASGGAVVISQYIGSKNLAGAGKAASQLLTASAVFAIFLSGGVLIGNERILAAVFGSVDAPVMDAAVTYLRISAYSYPALAIYDAGAAVYRSMGKTSMTMYISAVCNVINIVGNFIGVFILKAGVAGVAYPSLIAIIFSAIVITFLCLRKSQAVRYERSLIFQFDRAMLRRILNIAVPNGIENGFFQLVKVALSSITALFGTYQIAANGVAQSIWSLAALSGVAMNPVFTTVIGQCMGSGNILAAEHYFKRLIKITLAISAAWNIAVLAATPLFLHFYAIGDAAKELVLWLVLLHNVFNTVAFPFSSALGSGLRASGDVRYTLYTSAFSTVGVRLVLSYVFGVLLNMGVMGIAWAMCCDWTFRGIAFILRLKSGKWQQFKVI